MITKTNFIEIMNSQTEMALATSANNIPNVRIINFYFDTNTNTIFFTSFKKNKKIKEFEINPNIGFTTIPKNGVEHVKGNGVIKESNKNIVDFSSNFINKIPDYKELIENFSEHLTLFEIKIDTVTVTLNFKDIETIKL